MHKDLKKRKMESMSDVVITKNSNMKHTTPFDPCCNSFEKTNVKIDTMQDQQPENIGKVEEKSCLFDQMQNMILKNQCGDQKTTTPDFSFSFTDLTSNEDSLNANLKKSQINAQCDNPSKKIKCDTLVKYANHDASHFCKIVDICCEKRDTDNVTQIVVTEKECEPLTGDFKNISLIDQIQRDLPFLYLNDDYKNFVSSIGVFNVKTDDDDVAQLCYNAAFLVYQVCQTKRTEMGLLETIVKWLTVIKKQNNNVFDFIHQNETLIYFLLLTIYKNYSTEMYMNYYNLIDLLSISSEQFEKHLNNFCKHFYAGVFTNENIRKMIVDQNIAMEKHLLEGFMELFEPFVKRNDNELFAKMLSQIPVEVDLSNKSKDYFRIIYENLRNSFHILNTKNCMWKKQANHTFFEKAFNMVSECELFNFKRSFHGRMQIKILKERLEECLKVVVLNCEFLDEKKMFTLIVKMFNEFYVKNDCSGKTKRNFIWSIIRHFLKESQHNEQLKEGRASQLVNISIWLMDYVFSMKDSTFATHLRKNEYVFQWIKKNKTTNTEVAQLFNETILGFCKESIEDMSEKHKNLVYFCFLIEKSRKCSDYIEQKYPSWCLFESLDSSYIKRMVNNKKVYASKKIIELKILLENQ